MRTFHPQLPIFFFFFLWLPVTSGVKFPKRRRKRRPSSSRSDRKRIIFWLSTPTDVLNFLRSDAFDAPPDAQSWTSPPTLGRQASLLSVIAQLYLADSERSSSKVSNGAGSSVVAPSSSAANGGSLKASGLPAFERRRMGALSTAFGRLRK